MERDGSTSGHPAVFRKAIRDALQNFETGRLRTRVVALLEVLGYSSARHEEDFDFDSDEFLEWADDEAPDRRIAKKPREAVQQTLSRIDMVFQYTEGEFGVQADLFGAYQASRAESFLFLAVDLADGDHPRHKLAEMTRAINRPFMMPVIVFFRYRREDRSTVLTLAVIHRRAHRRDPERDVLERATLVKDIRVTNPHRAHVEILGDLALGCLELSAPTFDALHRAWERVLDTEKLNKRFYSELFEWFKRAVSEASFPDGARPEEQVIRLITRLLFVWFLKEKRLVAEDWFDERAMQAMLSDFGGSDYYRAVLENLFFETLNRPMDQRGFGTRARSTVGHRMYSGQRHQGSLIRDVDRFGALMRQTPFVNGGLFDRLDDEISGDAADATDLLGGADPDGTNAARHAVGGGDGPEVPDSLFFGEGGLIELLHRYKFTVEENTPVEIEVALDPELLGRVFENLLAAHNPETREQVRGDRKRTGSFYTPRNIVDYMVDQALILAIGTHVQPEDDDPVFWRERLSYLLDYEDGEDGGELFEEADSRAIIGAISKLRVLDPAVGSGAFAMAMLQKLTLALRRLDPDNEVWRQLQKERAMDRADSAFDERERSARDEELLEISEAFSRYSGDFGRKLYLIQNSIFGVDIQPIACSIARLRFFISLAIEQEQDESADNLGITPLPNLDTRIVAASTLLGLSEEQRTFPGDRAHDIEERLVANRERHFHARSRPEKLDCTRRDKALRKALATELREAGFSESVATKIADWDPYDQNASADWFVPRFMFGVREGFDILIGNPPYVRADFPDVRHKELRERIMESGRYETLWEKWDLFVPFIERGFRLLRPGGAITYIVSDAYCHAKYAEKSQRWFLSNARIVRLDFLSRLRVFEAAVRNVVFVYQKTDGRLNRPERRVHDGSFGRTTELPTNRQGKLTPRQLFFPEDTPSKQSEEYGNPTVALDRICYISVGMVANAHERLAPGEFRLADLVSDVPDERHPKRFVEGKHLARWLPNTYRWLEWGTPRAPGLFRRRTFPEMYEVDEKLIAQRSPGPDPVTCIDTDRTRFPESCVAFVPWRALSGVRNRSIKRKTRYRDEKPKRPDLPLREDLEETSSRFRIKFLLGVMNSSPARDFLLANRRSNIHLYPDDWARLPIPDCTEAEQADVARIVDAILTAKDSDIAADVRAEEKDLDRVVRNLYGIQTRGE